MHCKEALRDKSCNTAAYVSSIGSAIVKINHLRSGKSGWTAKLARQSRDEDCNRMNLKVRGATVLQKLAIA